MTSVQVSRHPVRARFESVQFGNRGLLADNQQDGEHNRDTLAPMVHLPELPVIEERVDTRQDRRDTVTGLPRLSVPYKRRSKKSSSLPSGVIITPGRQRGLEMAERADRKIPLINRARLTPNTLLKKFKMVVRITLLCIKESKKRTLRNNIFDEISPFVAGLAFHDYEVPIPDHNLAFDPNKFKANKQLRLSDESRRILVKPQHDRTKDEIRHALLSLRNISAFAEYPLRMQTKIAEVGFYEKYEAKRVIVRQGHPASAFYFILSGSIVVMVKDLETKAVQPVAYMSKGMTFGELAIINRSMRQSTVIAKETLELLSIDIKDFHRIFMAGGVKNIHDPDHEEFMRNIDFMKGWPVEVLPSNPTKCIFHYFKSGDILVKDSQFSDWIIIVKSGSLRVLKKLIFVSPRGQNQKDQTRAAKTKTEAEKTVEQEVRSKQRRYILPDIHVPINTVNNNEVVDDRFDHPQAIMGKKSGESYLMRLKKYAEKKQKMGLSASVDSFFAATCTSSQSSDDSENRLPKLPSNERPQTWTSHKKRHISPLQSSSTGQISSTESFASSSATENKIKKKRIVSKHSTHVVNLKPKKKKRGKSMAEEEEMNAEMRGRTQHVRTITEDLDRGRALKQKNLTTADLYPQFVEVQILTKGEVFGLTETLLHGQPSFCVVSNGAECILLNKALYLQNASTELIRRLRNRCCPYPSDEDLQQGLQVAVDWEAFRDITLDTTLHRLAERKPVK